MKDTGCHSQSVCIIHPQIQKLKKKKRKISEDVAEQKNSMSSNANPSVKVTPQKTRSPHILHMYTYTYVFR